MSTNITSLKNSKRMLRDIFDASIRSVSPVEIIRKKVHFNDGTLHIINKEFKLKKNVYLAGFGKAVMGMATVLEQMLGDSLKKGIVSIPCGLKTAIWESTYPQMFPKLKSGVIEYREGGLNNQPDDAALETTHKIIDMIEPLDKNDTLIVLISGGGSALLYMPRPIIDPEDKAQLCKTLQNAGADIKELNTVRRKLSLVKGGGLGRIAYPASVITLIISDIVGDPIDLIASGPTVYSDKGPDQVINILKKYDLYNNLEGDLKFALTSKDTFDYAPLLNSVKEYKHVENIILGNNQMALEAAYAEALAKKLTPVILKSDVTGNVQDVSLAYVHITSLICLAMEKVLNIHEFVKAVQDIPVLSLTVQKVDEIYSMIDAENKDGILLISGGEPTVIVKGDGKGGRNQELALHFSLDWLAKIKDHPQFCNYDVIMLSGGSDGQDGPTDAAGAFGYSAIGPIIYDLYNQIVSATKQELAHINDRMEASKQSEEKIVDPCKKQELSGFLNTHKLKKSSESESKSTPIDSASHVDYFGSQEVHPLVLQTMEIERMLPENVLKNNDSYNFYSRFKRGEDMIRTGPTGTNVMDLHFIYIKKRNCECKMEYDKVEKFQNTLDAHDLHIDPLTIEKYRSMHGSSDFKMDISTYKPISPKTDETDHINIKIIDDNLAEPCCQKNRKFPRRNPFKDTDIYQSLFRE